MEPAEVGEASVTDPPAAATTASGGPEQPRPLDEGAMRGGRVDASNSQPMPTRVNREDRVRIELEDMKVQVAMKDGHITFISTETAPEFGDDQIELLIGLPKLTHVNLHNSQVTDEGLKALAENTAITRLNLRRTENITGDGLAALTDYPNLEILELLYNSQSVDDDALGHVAKLTKLRLLDLRGCFQVSDEGLLKLETLTNMQDLKLRCTEITDEGIAVIGNMPKLRYLTIEDANYADCESLDVVADNDSFRSLTLFRLDLDDIELKPFEGCAGIVQANFRDTVVEGSGLDYLSDSATALKSLNLAESLFSDEYAANVAQFENLETLDLWYTDISDEGLSEIAKLKKLKTLILKQDRDITNEGLATLGTMKSLEFLDLTETSIDDEGLDALKSLSNLKTLVVAQTGVTREGAETLTESNPKLNIEF